jgi:hypothetical protein
LFALFAPDVPFVIGSARVSINNECLLRLLVHPEAAIPLPAQHRKFKLTHYRRVLSLHICAVPRNRFVHLIEPLYDRAGEVSSRESGSSERRKAGKSWRVVVSG